MHGNDSELAVKNLLQRFGIGATPGGLSSHTPENHLASVIPAKTGIHFLVRRALCVRGGDGYFHTVGWAEGP